MILAKDTHAHSIQRHCPVSTRCTMVAIRQQWYLQISSNAVLHAVYFPVNLSLA